MACFKRPLLVCLVCYVLGLWCVRELWPVAPAAMAALGGFACLTVGAWSVRRREGSPLFLLLFVVLGGWRMEGVERERLRAEELGARLEGLGICLVRGTVCAVDADGSDGRLNLRLRRASVVTPQGEAHRVPGYLQLAAYDRRADTAQPMIVPGDGVCARARVTLPESLANFAGFDARQWLALQRTYLVARAETTRLVWREESGASLRERLEGGLARLRRGACRVLAEYMAEHEARLSASMFFNDRRLLSEEDKRVFRDSGTMHLFAVSGLHVAIFAFLLSLLFRALRLSPRLSWSLVVAVLALYVTLLGFLAPASRAFLMILAYSCGQWLRREVDNLSALTFGAAAILFLDPLAAWQASFQLSLMGVAGIFLFVPVLGEGLRLDERRREGGRGEAVALWCAEGIFLSLAVALAILPLQFFYFQQFNLLAPLANLFLAPLSALVLGGAIFTLVFAVWFAPLGLLFGAAASACMGVIYVLAQGTAGQRWALLFAPQPALWTVWGYYLALFSGYYLVRRHTPEFRPKSLARLGIHAGAAAALLFVAAWWTPLSRPLRIWFLDVGQGDATLIELPSGQTLLVDAGRGSPDMGKLVVEAQLKALGRRPLDNLLATHYDEDHVGGMAWLVEHYPVRTWIGAAGNEPSSGAGRDLLTSVSARGLRRVQVCAGKPIRLDARTTLQVLSPDAQTTAGELSDNAHSIVLRVAHGRFSALLMGDAEGEVEKRLVERGIAACDILKVGHHGSRNATTLEFVAALRPKLALISCGRRNRYGHPAPEVLERLRALGVRVLRTDRHGAVLVESDGERFRVRTARGGR